MTGVGARLSVIAVLLGVAASIAACHRNGPSVDNEWAPSTAAPGRFSAKLASHDAIDLPASGSDFLRFMVKQGAHYWVPGQGEAKLLSGPPPPKPGSPCHGAAKGIVFSFEITPAYMPEYVAYIDNNDMVQCVDRQFSFPSIGP